MQAALTDLGTRLDSLGVRVFEKLDAISEKQGEFSERMATVETWGTDSREQARRWWDKTWPDHLGALNDALKAHGERLESLEKSQIAMTHIEKLEGELHDQARTIVRMEKFQVKLRIYVAMASCVSAAIATTLVEVGIKFLFHAS